MLGTVPAKVTCKIGQLGCESLIWTTVRDSLLDELKLIHSENDNACMSLLRSCPICESEFSCHTNKCSCLDLDDYLDFRTDNAVEVFNTISGTMRGIAKSNKSKSLTELEMIRGFEIIMAETLADKEFEVIEIADFLIEYLLCGIGFIIKLRPLSSQEYKIARALESTGIFVRNQKNNLVACFEVVD